MYMERPFSFLKRGLFPKFLILANFRHVVNFMYLQKGWSPLPPRQHHSRLFRLIKNKLGVTGNKLLTASVANFSVPLGGSNKCCKGLGDFQPCNSDKCCKSNTGCNCELGGCNLS